MSARYVLAPQAALDLFEIWHFIEEHSSRATADHVEASSERSLFSWLPHRRPDTTGGNLTEHNVKFFPVYSYLIVYRPQTNLLQVVSILHGRRDVE
ncbi:MAG TPA: type II toxin-antitoxin system RelE/ParE family toxin [Verrucomicrobiae bacterium]|nr:type II toxin-antitoxin system RelE/ParE family toxin [Verrucomicrobiae bacterium]